MDRETQVEVVNICIVNALRIDEDHRMMIIEKLTQNLTDENRTKLLRLLDVSNQREQLISFLNWYQDDPIEFSNNKTIVDAYLDEINCC
jgi:hypothetical protein